MSGTAFSNFAFTDSETQLAVLRETFKEKLGNKTSGRDILEYMKYNASIDEIVTNVPCSPPVVISDPIPLYWAACFEGLYTLVSFP